MPVQNRNVRGIFDYFHRRGIARIDFDRPKGAVTENAINAEQAAQAANSCQRLAEIDQLAEQCGRRSYGTEAAAILETVGEQPIGPDELPSQSQEAYAFQVGRVDSRGWLAVKILLPISLFAVRFGGIRFPFRDTAARRAATRFDEPAPRGIERRCCQVKGREVPPPESPRPHERDSAPASAPANHCPTAAVSVPNGRSMPANSPDRRCTSRGRGQRHRSPWRKRADSGRRSSRRDSAVANRDRRRRRRNEVAVRRAARRRLRRACWGRG